MNPDWFLVLAVLIGFSFVVWFIQQKINSLLNAKQDTTLIEWAKQTQQDIKSLQQEVSKVLLSTNKDLTATLQQSYGDLHKRLDKAAILIGDLKKEAGQFSEISRSMRDLQEFLTSPKLRGNIGEHVLKDLISQTFPKQAFHLQYQFKSGMKVDAAIKTDAGILPIDSKFPMENFKRMVGGETQADRVAAVKEFARDVKKHIDDISKKYILPEEGTMDFALMYVPSEPVFYEIVNRPALMDYARGARVYIVGPNTLYAHLQAILLGFEGKRIETKGREVLALLRAVQKDYEKVEGNLGVLGKHVTNTYNQMANVTGSFQLLGQKLASSQRLPAAEDSLKLGE